MDDKDREGTGGLSDAINNLIKYYKKIKAKKLDDYIFQDYEEK